jgi:hypothetical protein
VIDKWLKAGVLEDGLLCHAAEGSPQGGVISLRLSNIFLHHVLDEWFENAGSRVAHEFPQKSTVGMTSSRARAVLPRSSFVTHLVQPSCT